MSKVSDENLTNKSNKYIGLLNRMELQTENERLKQSVEKLTILNEIGKSMTTTLDPDKILPRIVDAAVFITGTEEGTLMLFDKQRGELYVTAQKGLEDKLAKRIKLKVDDSIAGTVLISRKIKAINREAKVLTGYLVKNIVYVPLVCRGEALGVLSVDNRKADKFINQDDIYLLSVLADYAAISLENSKLVTNLRRLNEVGRSILSVLKLEDVLRQIVENAHKVLGADSVVLYEYDKSKDDIIVPPIICGDFWDKNHLLQKDITHKQSVGFELIRRGKPVYAENAAVKWAEQGFTIKHEGFIAREGINSSAGIPLIVGREGMGVMFINYRKRFMFNNETKEIINLFASQAAIAIKNAKERKTIQWLANLVSTIQPMAKFPIALDEVLDRTVKGAKEVSDADFTLVFPYDIKTERFQNELIKHSEMSDVLVSAIQMPRPAGLTKRIIEDDDDILLVEDICDSEKYPFIHLDPQSFLVRAHIQSLVGIRLQVGKEPMGVLYADFCTPLDLGEDQLSILQLYANQAAIAIHNARQYEEVSQSKTAVQTLLDFRTEIAHTFDVNHVLERAVYKAVEIMKANGGHAYLVDYETGQLESRFSSKKYLMEKNSQILSDIIQEVVHSKHPYWNPDIQNDMSLRHIFISEIHSLLYIPILAHDAVLGVLGVGGMQSNQFDENSQKYLATLAYQAAGAIERSRLSNSLREIGSAIASTPSVLELNHNLTLLLQELTERLEFNFATISLVDDYKQTIETVQGVNVPTGWIKRARYKLDSKDIQPDVVISGKTEVIAGWDDRFNREIYYRFGHDRFARVFAPIKVSDKVVAVIEAGCMREQQAELLSPDRVRAVEELGQEWAIRIAGARPYVLLEQIADHSSKIIGADAASIHIYQSDDIFLEAGAGKATREFIRKSLPNIDGIGRQAMEAGNLIIIDDPKELAALHPAIYAEGVRAIAAFPLSLGRDVRGIMYVHYWREHQFSSAEKDLESVFAQQMEIVIQNFLFLKNLADTAERAQMLSWFKNVILSLTSSLDLSRVLEDVTQNVLYILDADNITLYQYYQQERRFDKPVIKGYFNEGEYMNEPVSSDSVVWRVVGHGESLFASDVNKEPLLSESIIGTNNRRRFVNREGIVSSAALVLKDREMKEIVGLLFVNYRTSHTFEREEQEMINALASSVALAIHTARLHDRVWKDLAAKVAHIIGTRISIIQNEVSWLRYGQDQKEMSPFDKESLVNLTNHVVKAQKVLIDFRQFAAPIELKLQKIDLTEVVRGVIPEVKHMVKCSIDLVLSSVSAWVNGDQQQLSDAFIELIRNADDAKGIANQSRQRKITITLNIEAETMVRIEFADNGPGISNANKERVFEPFFTGKSRGSGLGLTIVKNVIEQHHGRIEEIGIEGEGARFVVRLPLLKDLPQ